MRISIDDALSWGARSQGLSPHRSIGGLSLTGAAAAMGPLAAQPNHVPFLSLRARFDDFSPQSITVQAGSPPDMLRIAGPRAGFILAPASRIPALSVLARTNAKAATDDAIAPLQPEEVRTAVDWIHRRLKGQGAALPAIREGAPADLMRHVERGSTRALHKESALEQVLRALELRGDVVSALASGPNTSEGPYRYYLRSDVAPGPAPASEDAFAEIAEWYIGGFAPVGPRDFAAWSGLPEFQCRRAFGAVRTPLRTVNVAGLDENLLAPAEVCDQPVVEDPICAVLPFLDGWLQAYRGMERFIGGELPGVVAPRDLVLVCLVRGASGSGALAGRIGLVGSARQPRLQWEPWRPLAEHETAFLRDELDRLSGFFIAPR